MVPPPDENLAPRRTVTQAAEERAASNARAENIQAEAEAKWAAENGMETGDDDSTPTWQRPHAPGEAFTRQEPQEPQDEDEELEDAEEDDFADVDTSGFEGDGEDEDGPEADEEEDEPEEKPARKRRKARRRTNAATKKAREILTAQGVPQAVLDQASPDDLVAWGLEVAGKGASLNVDAAETTQRQGTPLELSDEAYAELADKLAVPVSDLKAAHGPLIQGLLDTVRQELDGRLAPLEGEVRQSSQAQTRQLVMGNLERLSQYRPELKTDPDLQADLTEAAAEHWNARTPSGARLYGSLEEAFDAAYRSEVGEMVPNSTTSDTRKRRRRGTATIPSGRSTARATPRTQEQFDQEVFNALNGGKSPEWVQRNVKKPSRSGRRGSRSRRN